MKRQGFITCGQGIMIQLWGGFFISKDTYEGQINNPLILNLYTYFHNNPLIYIDPTGNYCVSADGKNSHYGGCNGGQKGKEYHYDIKGSMYIPDSYYAASRQSWGAELIGKSFDQLYVKYQMELLSKQLTNFFEDVTGASALRTLTSPDTSPLDALIALSSISLPGVKGKPENPLKTQKAGKTLKLTSTQAGDLANYLGFKIVKGASIKKQPVYTNGKIFISPDVDSHIGGVWKAAKTIKDLGSKETRYGTYDVFLNYVGK
ncbi:hypothetical protein D3C74_238250 [compost metagenome]